MEASMAGRVSGARSRRSRRATARLNLLDELYLHLDRPQEPWGVHFEVDVAGRLDDARLADAIAAAAARHPIARARLARTRATDARYDWEIMDRLGPLPLEGGWFGDRAAL